MDLYPIRGCCFFPLLSKLIASYSSTSRGPGRALNTMSGNEVANMSLLVLEITPRHRRSGFEGSASGALSPRTTCLRPACASSQNRKAGSLQNRTTESRAASAQRCPPGMQAALHEDTGLAALWGSPWGSWLGAIADPEGFF